MVSVFRQGFIPANEGTHYARRCVEKLKQNTTKYSSKKKYLKHLDHMECFMHSVVSYLEEQWV